MTLEKIYEDMKAAKELSEQLYNDLAWEASGDLANGAETAEKIATLMDQVAADLDALEQALTETRGA